jgi:hypothetical protein
MRMYMAGPLFTVAERAFNESLRDALVRPTTRCGFLRKEHRRRARPRRQSSIATSRAFAGRRPWWRASTVPTRTAARRGRSASHTGSALSRVLYRTDFRPAGDDKWVNLMLSVSARVLVRAEFLRLRDVATEINRALTEVERGLQV